MGEGGGRGMMGSVQRGREAVRRGGPGRAHASVRVGDRQEGPYGALQVAIDKDSPGKILSLVLRHSSVIQPCLNCHETEKGGK